ARLVDLGADAEAGGGRGGRRGSGRGGGFVPPDARHGQEGSREAAASEQLATGDSFSAHRAPPRHSSTPHPVPPHVGGGKGCYHALPRVLRHRSYFRGCVFFHSSNTFSSSGLSTG